MDSVIVWIAKYLLFVMCAGLAVVWLWRERGRGRLELAAAAVVGLGLTLAFIVIAGKLHTDPRPFVQDPSIKPLFQHAPDNGFPSDHSSAAGLIAALALLRRHWLAGTALAVCAAAVAWSRVAAHVHHLQDVAAGLALGVLAAVIAVTVVGALLRRYLPVRAAAEPARHSAV